jgi:hypothetical protein
MAANITIYCLENVTDYFEFERLCHDLMSLEGYSSVEPLGGFKDKGRDAIHVSRTGETTIFAYSVREDWRAKLAEDATKIRKHGHTCDQLNFITTAQFTSGERDEAIEYIRKEFNWHLELFGVERLRILLDVNHPQIKALHPQIFPPEFLKIQNQLGVSGERDHLFISCIPEDGALADWLTQKLTAEGYLVWCERFKLLGGESYPDDIDHAIKNRTFRVIGLYSQASLKNPEVMRQRMLALGIGSERKHDFLIPLNIDGITPNQLDRVTSSLTFISFEHNWAKGLQQLLKKLETIGCPKVLPDGKRVAAEAFLEKDVLSEQTELLFSNCLRFENIPEHIHRFEAPYKISRTKSEEFKFTWAYRQVNPRLFLSFHHPPSAIKDQYHLKLSGEGVSWREVETIHGIWARKLVSELLHKSLIVKCSQKGLRSCPSTHLHYFPSGLLEGDHLKYTKPDGSKTFVSVVGQRKFWRPSGSEDYRYYLAPVFSVVQNLFDEFTILVRIRIRFSDTEGRLLPARTANSRRKHLCKNWWNDDWLNRILAICQFFADEEKIVIGEQEEEQIIIHSVPLQINAPLSIDETMLDQLSYERSELLALQDENEPEEDTEEGKTDHD